ncbi:MAG TPA: TonB family protein [Vicinamibacterales bacterium]|jgi:protein TonB|nr:TonB family protein [Vicinamibacterales bacterium]
MLVSTATQLVIVGLLVVVPVLFVTHALPQPPTMMAFVAAPPPPPPPPPPPAPAQPAKKAEPVAATPSASHFAAPIEAPAAVRPEPAGEEAVGVSGGVEGGVPGGVVGGVVGGLPEAPPPPPPPPPPPAAPRAPVRIGGQIQPPTLIRRVEPAYPPMAVSAHVQGTVILEAVVDESGAVTDVKVLRSGNPLLDREALIAVRQWRYSPVVLNGTPVRFVLSVVLSFSLQDRG